MEKAKYKYLKLNNENITIYSTCKGIGLHYYLSYYFDYDKINMIHNYNLIRDKNDFDKYIKKY